MKKQTKFIFIKLFLIFFFHTVANASISSFIVVKVNDEIITNLDIIEESNYLVALNNELKNLDKNSIFTLAKNSLIREKIKRNELAKYYKFDHTKSYLNKILENFYLNLNLNNVNEFENYLKNFNLDLITIKKKIEIELLWNEMIVQKYSKQIDFDKDKLKKKIIDQKMLNDEKKKYELSEIMFQVDKKKNLKEMINEIKESITSKGFKNTANIYSISDTSKFGGKIGWINEEQLSTSIIKEIKKLNIGETTDPINVSGGFLILKLENIKTEKIEINLDVALNNLIQSEKNRQLNQFSVFFFNKLKLNSKINEQ